MDRNSPRDLLHQASNLSRRWMDRRHDHGKYFNRFDLDPIARQLVYTYTPNSALGLLNLRQLVINWRAWSDPYLLLHT